MTGIWSMQINPNRIRNEGIKYISPLICGVCYEDSAEEICLMLAEPSRESLPRPHSQRQPSRTHS